jgi:hypothetical protein
MMCEALASSSCSISGSKSALDAAPCCNCHRTCPAAVLLKLQLHVDTTCPATDNPACVLQLPVLVCCFPADYG